jgi:hypothetical protein
MKRALGLVFATALWLLASAHVGSPDVVFDGMAGPYPVRVVVRPPDVVPGLADVVVRAADPSIQHVTIRPVFWRVGVAGAPSGDEMTRVAGTQGVYTGRLWLMAYGSYSVYVTVSGARGAGTVIVPVAALATGRLPLPRGLTAVLAVLGALLVAGLITIIYVASGESLVPPGEEFDAPRRRRASLVTAVAVPVLALLLFGGAKWWNAADAAYRRNMYGAPAAEPTTATDATHRTLTLTVHDTARFRALSAPLIPDHGKMVHLFLIAANGSNAFAHLHPVEHDSGAALVFTGQVPALPAGRYRLFADLTLENGLSLTVTNMVDLPAAPSTVAVTDSDDAWVMTPSVPRGVAGARSPLGDGYTLAWNDSTPIAAHDAVDLAFTVRDSSGRVATLQPYMGMAAHAAVVASNGSVFIHLHPMGTVATAAQQVFRARDLGDTTAHGRLDRSALGPGAGASTATMSGMPAMSMSGQISFPYEFPKPGRYRIWVQVKPGARVLTGTFDVDVH